VGVSAVGWLAALAMIRARMSRSAVCWSGSSRLYGLSGGGAGWKSSDSCTGALRADRLLGGGAGIGQTPQQTVDDDAQPQQVGNRPQPGRRKRGHRTGIRPIHRNQQRIAVRRRQEQVQASFAQPASEHGHHLAFKGVAAADDPYLVRQSLVMGSLSMGRSTG
jgi:hypothetical protein